MLFVFVIFTTFNCLAIGITLIIILYFFHNANLNPAISIILVFSDKLNKYELIPFIIAQLSGGLIGYQLALRYKSVVNNIITLDKVLYQVKI